MDPGIYLTKLLNEYLPNQFLSHVLTTSILLILLNSIKKYCSILTLLILIKRIIMLIIFNYFDCIDHIDRIGFWILIICLGHTAWAAGVTYQRSYNWDFLCFILACCLSSFPEAAL